MSETKLILHVKGTEGGTQELPKEEVRHGLSQGKITYSQLIWSAADNTWKQARDYPDLAPSDPLILHVKGTEAETRHVPKQDVRSAIARGQITHSQLIWSTTENAWKQVREMPELLPSQKLAPAPAHAPAPIAPEASASPVARAEERAVPQTANPQAHAPAALMGSPKPKVRVAAPAGAAPQPKVAAAGAPKVAAASGPKVSTGGAPKVAAVGAPKMAAAGAPRMAAAGSPSVRAQAVAGRSSGSVKVHEEDEHFHPLKWVCIVLGSVLAVLLIANFFLVSLPLSSKFGRTSFSNVTVYAHFGAFMQPNVMVIHIVPSSEITEENLTDVLVALARSSPVNPFTRSPFDRVAITSGWTAQYSFSGSSWSALGQLDQGDFQQRKEMILAQMDDASGEPLITPSTLNEQAQEANREKIWRAFVKNFTAAH